MLKRKDSVRQFILAVAEMKIDGEEDDEGETYVQENDDAIDTLGILIEEARRIVDSKEV